MQETGECRECKQNQLRPEKKRREIVFKVFNRMLLKSSERHLMGQENFFFFTPISSSSTK